MYDVSICIRDKEMLYFSRILGTCSLFPRPNVTVGTYVNIYNITPPGCSRDAG
jgi:hypothetical protein